MARSIRQDIKDALTSPANKPLTGEALRTKVLADRAKKAAEKKAASPTERNKRRKRNRSN